MNTDQLIAELTDLRAQAEMAHLAAQQVLARSQELQQYHAELCEEQKAKRHFLRRETNRPPGHLPPV